MTRADGTRVVAIVQARMASSRLPGKVLRPILGRPMLEHLVERAGRAENVDAVVVATSVEPADDAIEEASRRMGIGCYRGSEDDVLLRVVEAARAFDVEVIVELTGDNPLVDHRIIDAVVDRYFETGVAYASNTLDRTAPLGINAQVFSLPVLEEVLRLTDDPADHEHVSLYIYEHPERFSLASVSDDLPPSAAELRLTVDTEEDFRLVNEVFGRLHPGDADFSTSDVVALLDREPALRSINAEVQQRQVR